MNEWQDFESFMQNYSYSKAQIAKFVKDGEVEAKNIKGELFLRYKENNLPILKNQILKLHEEETNSTALMQETLEKVLDIYSKFSLAKDEVIASYKNENDFLKSTILSMQEAYMQDKKMLDFLREEAQKSKEELEAMKKKYQLMWGKATQKNKD